MPLNNTKISPTANHPIVSTLNQMRQTEEKEVEVGGGSGGGGERGARRETRLMKLMAFFETPQRVTPTASYYPMTTTCLFCRPNRIFDAFLERVFSTFFSRAEIELRLSVRFTYCTRVWTVKALRLSLFQSRKLAVIGKEMWNMLDGLSVRCCTSYQSFPLISGIYGQLKCI